MAGAFSERLVSTLNKCDAKIGSSKSEAGARTYKAA